MAITTSATPAVGAATLDAAIQGSATLPKVYISDVTLANGELDAVNNTVVVGDLVTNIQERDVALSGRNAISQTTNLDGNVTLAIGDYTYDDLTLTIAAPSSDAKVGLLIAKSDRSATGFGRIVNMNIQNSDGSVDKFFVVVAGATYIQPDGTNAGAWRFTLTPFSSDLEALSIA